MSQRLQVPGQPCHLYSGLDVAGSRPSVSPVEWARSSRLQAFCFSSTVGRRLEVTGLPFRFCSGPETPGSSVSAKVQFCGGPGSRLQFSSEAPPFHLYSSSNFSSAACQRFARQKSAQHPSLSEKRLKRSSVSPLQWARSSRLQTFRFTSTVSQRFQVPGQPCHLYSGFDVAGSRPSVSPVE